jgi:hypothetical protein
MCKPHVGLHCCALSSNSRLLSVRTVRPGLSTSRSCAVLHCILFSHRTFVTTSGIGWHLVLAAASCHHLTGTADREVSGFTCGKLGFYRPRTVFQDRFARMAVLQAPHTNSHLGRSPKHWAIARQGPDIRSDVVGTRLNECFGNCATVPLLWAFYAAITAAVTSPACFLFPGPCYPAVY